MLIGAKNIKFFTWVGCSGINYLPLEILSHFWINFHITFLSTYYKTGSSFCHSIFNSSQKNWECERHIRTGRHMGLGTVTWSSIPNWIVFHTQEHTHEHVHVQHTLALHWKPVKRNCTEVPSTPLISCCLTTYLSISIIAPMCEHLCTCTYTNTHKHTHTPL